MPIKRSLFLLGLILVARAWIAADNAKPANDNSQRGSTLKVESGTLLTADGVPIQLRQVNAKIIKNKSKPNCSDGNAEGDKGGAGAQDKDDAEKKNASEVVDIQAGTVILSSDSLTKLLDKKVGKNGKLSDLKFSTDPKKNEVHISGKAKKVIGVPFDLQGPVKATDDGKIQLNATSVKAADIPGLAGLLGLTVQKAAGKDAAKGVKTNENTIIFNPDQLWGLPVHGSVTKVTVQQKGIMLVFGNLSQTGGKAAPSARAPRPSKPDPQARKKS